MNYELAKQLKEAGFPLVEIHSPAYHQRPGRWATPVLEEERAGCMMCGFPFLQIDDKYYLQPVLDVLIEACGEKFCELVQQDNYVGWHARGDDKWPEKLPSYNLIEGSGKTPEEAVAKLWLELNNKLKE